MVSRRLWRTLGVVVPLILMRTSLAVARGRAAGVGRGGGVPAATEKTDTNPVASFCRKGTSQNASCTIDGAVRLPCVTLAASRALDRNAGGVSTRHPDWNICQTAIFSVAETLTVAENASITCEQPEPPKSVNCNKRESRPTLCELRLYADEVIVEKGATVTGNSVNITAKTSILIKSGGSVDVTARGVPPFVILDGNNCKPPGQPNHNDELAAYGASHGGSGGMGGGKGVLEKNPNPQSYTKTMDNAEGTIIGNASYLGFDATDFEWGYGGVCLNAQTCGGVGGGRAVLYIPGSKGEIQIDGGVFARGQDAPALGDEDFDAKCCGAGSGGSILIVSGNIKGEGSISAAGGNGLLLNKPKPMSEALATADPTVAFVRGSGGGGRVVLRTHQAAASTSSGIAVDAYGGYVQNAPDVTETWVPAAQGAPGTILKDVVNFSAELDVWNDKTTGAEYSTLLAITPVRLNNAERVSVFTIGKSTNQYGNVVSDQLMMCDVAQFCKIAASSSSTRGIYVNTLGTLVFEALGPTPSHGEDTVVEENGDGYSPVSIIYKVQAHALSIQGCFQYNEAFILSIELGNGGLTLGSSQPSQTPSINYKQGTIRVTSHGVIDIYGSVGTRQTSCVSSPSFRLFPSEPSEPLRQTDPAGRHALAAPPVSEIGLDARTILSMRALGAITLYNSIDVDLITLLSTSSITVESTGSITKPTSAPRCLKDVNLRKKCDNILLAPSVTSQTLDEQPWPSSNFTVTIGVTGSGAVTLAQGSNVEGERMLFCSDNGTVGIEGSLFTTGYGCGAGSGPSNEGNSPFTGGGGACLDQTYGGGGAHWGDGGEGCGRKQQGMVATVPVTHVSAPPPSPPSLVCNQADKMQPVEGGHSHLFVMESEPLLSGAGGGCQGAQGSSGNGGGVIVINTKTFTLGSTTQTQCVPSSSNKCATVMAEGQEGSQGGGGGGAGGSISIEADFIFGYEGGKISASGGSGGMVSPRAAFGDDNGMGTGGGGGGGGGGGRLYVRVPRILSSTELANEDWTEHFHSNLSVSGGGGVYLNGSGTDGKLAASKCGYGYALASLSEHQVKLKCEECQAGTFVESAGVCAKCSPGKFQSCCKRDACIPCGNHTFCAKEGCRGCDMCPAGTYSADPTNANCKTCPVCDDQKSVVKGKDGVFCRPKTGAFFCNQLENGRCVDNNTSPGSGSISPGDLPSMHVPLSCSDDRCTGADPTPEELAVTVCSYRCKNGLIAPNCITALEAFIESIGGLYVFIGGIGISAIIFGIIFGIVCRRAPCCSVYKMRHQAYLKMTDLDRMPGSPRSRLETRRRGVSRTDEHVGAIRGNAMPSPYYHASGEFASSDGRDSPALAGRRLPASSLSSPLMQPSPLTQSRGGSRGSTSGARENGGSKHPAIRWELDCPRMAVQDLPAHASRLLPDGANAPGVPWRIPLKASWATSSGVEVLVDEHRYSQFAERLNALVDWPEWGWETWCLSVLRLVWYPLATEFLRHRREVRASRLVKMVRGYDHSMLQGNRARVLQNSIFLYISVDCTIFWLDVLQRHPSNKNDRRDDAVAASKDNIAGETRISAAASFDEPASGKVGMDVIGAPHLPMLLYISGDGKPASPFHLDLNDVLNSSIPSLPVLHDFIDNRWVDFVMCLNERLRTVHCDFKHIGTDMKDVLLIIEHCNAADYLKGLALELIFVWPNAKRVARPLHNPFFDQDEEAADQTMRCHRVVRSNARLALKISERAASYSQSGTLSVVDSRLKSMESKSSKMGKSVGFEDTASKSPSSPSLSMYASGDAMVGRDGTSLGPGDKTWKLASKTRRDRNISRSGSTASMEDIFSAPQKKTAKHVARAVSRPLPVRSIRDRMLGEDADADMPSFASTSPPGSTGAILSSSPASSGYYAGNTTSKTAFEKHLGQGLKFSHKPSMPRLRKDTFSSQKDMKLRSGWSRSDVLRATASSYAQDHADEDTIAPGLLISGFGGAAEHTSSDSSDNSQLEGRTTVSPSKESQVSVRRMNASSRGSGAVCDMWVTTPDLVSLGCAAEPVSLSNVFPNGRAIMGGAEQDDEGEGGMNVLCADSTFDNIARLSLSVFVFLIGASWLVSVAVPVYVVYIGQIENEGYYVDCPNTGIGGTSAELPEACMFDNIELQSGIIFGASALVVSFAHVMFPKTLRKMRCCSGVSTCLSRNRNAPKSGVCRTLNAVGFPILLCGDLVVTGYMLIDFACINDVQCSNSQQQICSCDRTGNVVLLAIFPLSYLIAPVVGLLSYSFGLLVWWRRYVNILIASLLPTVASVIIYVNYFASLSAMEMSIVTSHVVIKMLLALFAQEHIATLLVGNDKRKRKRLRKHGGEAFSETGLSPVFSAGETALAAAFK